MNVDNQCNIFAIRDTITAIRYCILKEFATGEFLEEVGAPYDEMSDAISNESNAPFM